MQAPDVFHARPRQLSRAEYDRMAQLGFFQGERLELIHGIVVRMTPIGPQHSEIVDRLTTLCVGAVGGAARVRIQQPFLATDESEPEPDVAIVPARSYATAHPAEALLIIEVAETSLAYDRSTKAPLYAASNVAEYWVIDIGARSVEVFTAPVSGEYTHVRRAGVAEEITPQALPGLLVSVRELFD